MSVKQKKKKNKAFKIPRVFKLSLNQYQTTRLVLILVKHFKPYLKKIIYRVICIQVFFYVTIYQIKQNEQYISDSYANLLENGARNYQYKNAKKLFFLFPNLRPLLLYFTIMVSTLFKISTC